MSRLQLSFQFWLISVVVVIILWWCSSFITFPSDTYCLGGPFSQGEVTSEQWLNIWSCRLYIYLDYSRACKMCKFIEHLSSRLYTKYADILRTKDYPRPSHSLKIDYVNQWEWPYYSEARLVPYSRLGARRSWLGYINPTKVSWGLVRS